MTPHELAVSYISRGWPVFPCRPADEMGIDPFTGEEELKRAKTPYPTNGLKSATLNRRNVDRRWQDHPDAMVGIPTGRQIDAWVLDVDVDPEKGIDGYNSLGDLVDENGPLPETLRSKTPRGGTHFYFRYREGITTSPGLLRNTGIDVRGDGGFCIGPGSVRRDGVRYEWENPDTEIAEAPQWLIDLILPKRLAPRQASTYRPSADNSAYVEAAVDAELSVLSGHLDPGRGYQLNKSAFSLGTLVGTGVLSRSDAEAGLYAAAATNGLLAKDGEREVNAKIRRGITAGMREPREIPESDFRMDGSPIIPGIECMVAAKRAAMAVLDAVVDDAAMEVVADESVPLAANSPVVEPDPMLVIAAAANDDLSSDFGTSRPVKATPFRWIDPKQLPRRDFLYGTHFIRKYVSVTVAPGGLGKTSMSIAESLAMVTGRPLLGDKPPKPLKVWLFNAEDPRDEMSRRIMAAALHYKMKPEDFGDKLFLDTGREQELVIAYDDKRGIKIAIPVVQSVIETIIENKIDVMIIDPFVSTHGVPENDNGAIDKVAKLWAKIADQTNTAIEIVHHVRKTEGGRDVSVEDARGAGALIAAARSARVLNRMTEEQAAEAGVNRADRFAYFSVLRGKSNLSAMSGRSEWRKLVSIPLGNGRGMTQPQDHAGVVTEWMWPTIEEVASEVTPDQMSNLLSLLGTGSYKAAANAKPWAGEAIAAALGLDIEEKAVRKRAAKLLKQWIDEGVLVAQNDMDPMTRKMSSFILAA